MDLRDLLLIVAVSGGATALLLAWRRRTVASPWAAGLALALGGLALLRPGHPWTLVAPAIGAWALGVLLPARLLVAARRAAGRGELAEAARWAGWLAWGRRRPIDRARRALYHAVDRWWAGDARPLEVFCAQAAADPALDGFLAGAWAWTHQWDPLVEGAAPLGLQIRAHCERGEVAAGVALAGRLWPRNPSLGAARDARLASLAPLAFGGRRHAVDDALRASKTPPAVADAWRATAAWAAGCPGEAELLIDRRLAEPALPAPLRGVLTRRRAHPPAVADLDGEAQRTLDDLAREVRVGALLRLGGRAPMIWGLAASLVLAFGWQTIAGGATFSTLIDLGGLYVAPHGGSLAGPRMLRYAWLHGGAVHLLVNLTVILGAGPMVERLYGRWPTLGLYLASVLGAAAAILGFGHPGLTIGASGGAMGLVGALLVGVRLQPWARGARTARLAVSAMATLLALQLVWELGQAQVSSAGHLGGLATGLLVGAVLNVLGRPGAALSPRRASSPGSRTPGPPPPDPPA